MRKYILGFATIGLSLTQGAFAGRILPAPLLNLEAVTVKHIVQEGDFMPPLPPGSTGKPATTLTVQVDSNGCTDAKDFVVKTSSTPQGEKLAIVRVRPDTCRGYFPEGVEVQLTTGIVGFGKLFVANPVRVEDRTTH